VVAQFSAALQQRFAVEKVSEAVIVVGWVHGASNGAKRGMYGAVYDHPAALL
jgi:hypothetical protein